MTDNQTSVQQIDIDVDSLFSGAPGAESVVTPTDAPTEIKPNIFSKKGADLSFLDKEESKEETEDKKEQPVSRETY